MNIYVKHIMELLGLNEDDAMLVNENCSIDYSEATQKEIDNEIKSTYAFLKVTGDLK